MTLYHLPPEKPPEGVEPAVAALIMRREDHSLGCWDSTHIEAITGRSWLLWAAAFALVPSLQYLIPSMRTRAYLEETGRYFPIRDRALLDFAAEHAPLLVTPPASDEIFCIGEMQRFPVADFLRRGGRLALPEVHLTDVPHYAGSGKVYEPE